jgi:hypothetical protein
MALSPCGGPGFGGAPGAAQAGFAPMFNTVMVEVVPCFVV